MSRSTSADSRNKPSGLLQRIGLTAQLQVLLVSAILLGGGGIAHGYRHMALQLLALLLLALNRREVVQFWREASRPLRILVALTLVLPLLHLIPLPPSIWQSLPGRDLVIQAFELSIGTADRWHPLSVDPLRTLLAFCSLIVPATVIMLGFRLSAQDRLLLGRTFVIVAAATLILGAVQLSSANTIGILQDIDADAGVLYATFSNRNSTALFFLLALITIIALPLPRDDLPKYLLIGGGVFFALAVILTQSRSGQALLLAPVALLALRLIWRSPVRGQDSPAVKTRTPLFVAAAVVVLLVALGMSYAAGGPVADSFTRLTNMSSARWPVWEDSLFVAQRYWPFGSGIGTFDEVFQIDESLEYVGPARPGRAHNDYLEIWIETGFATPLLLLGWIGWGAWATLRSLGGPDMWPRIGAATCLACFALQSILDYPIRNQAMLCLAALFIIYQTPWRGRPT